MYFSFLTFTTVAVQVTDSLKPEPSARNPKSYTPHPKHFLVFGLNVLAVEG